ncbi:hypothetical protein H9P43_006794 [Blastocladiella emersonii ATCC 22665]|nr:hypothetical protein H9P43_006794 [Blastocladiella emersonii ATCC 22665]
MIRAVERGDTGTVTATVDFAEVARAAESMLKILANGVAPGKLADALIRSHDRVPPAIYRVFAIALSPEMPDTAARTACVSVFSYPRAFWIKFYIKPTRGEHLRVKRLVADATKAVGLNEFDYADRTRLPHIKALFVDRLNWVDPESLAQQINDPACTLENLLKIAAYSYAPNAPSIPARSSAPWGPAHAAVETHAVDHVRPSTADNLTHLHAHRQQAIGCTYCAVLKSHRIPPHTETDCVRLFDAQEMGTRIGKAAAAMAQPFKVVPLHGGHEDAALVTLATQLGSDHANRFVELEDRRALAALHALMRIPHDATRHDRIRRIFAWAHHSQQKQMMQST